MPIVAQALKEILDLRTIFDLTVMHKEEHDQEYAEAGLCPDLRLDLVGPVF